MTFRTDGVVCPCCGSPVDAPSFELLVDALDVSRDQASVLLAIWKGKGTAVSTQRIFDAMYANDRSGGPSSQLMYSALKMRLHKLREKLEGSGVAIESAGYGRGYRIVMKGRS